MMSAFGVEHTISKSFVNGKFVRAVDLSAKQARKVKTGGQWKKARGATKFDTQFKETMASPQMKEFSRTAGTAVNRELPKDMGQGGTVRLGSKSGGQSIVAAQAGSKKTLNQIASHEKHHANVKRSSYRLHAQIGNNPKKLFREEARADWHSQGHYKNAKKATSVYAGMARSAREIKRGNAAGPAKLTPAESKGLKELRRSQPEVRHANNREYLQNNAAMVNANTPHYGLHSEKKALKTANAYRKLQNDFKRRGVRRNP